jgi:hypothetical protein
MRGMALIGLTLGLFGICAGPLAAQQDKAPPPRPGGLAGADAGGGETGAAGAVAAAQGLPVIPGGTGVASAPGALLRGLDKSSGTTTDIPLMIGDTKSFGRLSISLTDCRYPVADPGSNAYAQLIVFDPGQDRPAFDGWMVATSPALSALDDARYDIWVLRCISS